MIPSELERKLKACRKLPSPPSFALQVIDLAHDPDVDIDRVVRVIALDPVIVSKILRVANSPLYANQRKVENLQLAILLLGLNATLSLALSFSFASGLKEADQGATLNYPLYWKRAGLAAAASRVLGKYCGIRDLEELFVAALLQDIGMLALDHVCPELYAVPELNQIDHGQVVSHEQQECGVNHAAVGKWLLAQWQLPERLQLAVAYSEEPLLMSPEDERVTFVRCVAGAGTVANLLLNGPTESMFQTTSEKLREWVKLLPTQLADILQEMIPVIVEVEHLFDMPIGEDVNPEDMIEMAREGLVLQTLKMSRENERLKTSTMHLEFQYDQLEDQSQRDGLTGLFNRAFLDDYLDKAFQQAVQAGTPLSLGFVDLDNFKQVNDTWGHQAGDQILKATAEILEAKVRSSDVVGRYGGEEFVVVLPGTPSAGASNLFQRIVDAFRHIRHAVSAGRPITVTASIGVVTHSPDRSFPNVHALVNAADQALYAAKNKGRNNCVVHGELPVKVVG